ncbi:hypothetical protein KIL84_014614 [Mauremys mutica]|uniref:Uncharacterized protein n=1 Tax=Mauremys mutica TaxID=74926 RepID=A0A9D3XRD9_9SAUR|nr:hypothetical protein KIL84_014614 [Mauremys mutica]
MPTPMGTMEILLPHLCSLEKLLLTLQTRGEPYCFLAWVLRGNKSSRISLPLPQAATPYDAAFQALDDHFNPLANAVATYFKFCSCVQMPHKPIDHYTIQYEIQMCCFYHLPNFTFPKPTHLSPPFKIHVEFHAWRS